MTISMKRDINRYNIADRGNVFHDKNLSTNFKVAIKACNSEVRK